jgi:hypothetical protein
MKKILVALFAPLVLAAGGCGKPAQSEVNPAATAMSMAVYSDWESARKGGSAARSVVRYNDLMKQVADKARKPGYSKTDWRLLAEVVSPNEFQRFGNFLEVQNWDQYVDMLDRWAPSSKSFSTRFRRMTEQGNLVFLELEEVHDTGKINSVSIYELNDAGKIIRLHIYLQAPRSS